MLVQARADRIRLIRQHDHALAAGALARRWQGGEGVRAGPPFRVVLATALHDLAWRELDAEPRFDPDRGLPFSFDDFPLEEKLAAWSAGLGRLEEISPWAGLLGSLHYASFLDDGRAAPFLEAEAERRDRLLARLEARHRPPAGGEGGAGRGRPLRERAAEDLAWLKLFDALSIRLCLAPPGVPDGALPPWMDRHRPLATPGGGRLETRWEGESRVRVDPPVFGEGLDLGIPCRDLPAPSYPDAAALAAAWREAGERTWRLRVLPVR